jgi:hypothetical protein
MPDIIALIPQVLQLTSLAIILMSNELTYLMVFALVAAWLEPCILKTTINYSISCSVPSTRGPGILDLGSYSDPVLSRPAAVRARPCDFHRPFITQLRKAPAVLINTLEGERSFFTLAFPAWTFAKAHSLRNL